MDERSQAPWLLGWPLFSQTHSHVDSAVAPRAWLPLCPAELERRSAPPAPLASGPDLTPLLGCAVGVHLCLQTPLYFGRNWGSMETSLLRSVCPLPSCLLLPSPRLHPAPNFLSLLPWPPQTLGWPQCCWVSPHLHPTRRHILNSILILFLNIIYPKFGSLHDELTRII